MSLKGSSARPVRKVDRAAGPHVTLFVPAALPKLVAEPRLRSSIHARLPMPLHGGMLTKEILFGMNILTLAGFIVMGLTLTLNRMGADW